MPATTLPAYLYPPRATACMPHDQAFPFYAKLGWIAQLKYNDTHILLDYQDHRLTTIWDRHGGHPTYTNCGYTTTARQLKDDLEQLGRTLPGPGRYLLDGGLLHDKHPAIKDTIALWDALIVNGRHLLGTTYQERYALLRTELLGDPQEAYSVQLPHAKGHPVLGTRYRSRLLIPNPLDAALWPGAWQLVQKVNEAYLGSREPLLEGLVWKNPRGKLMHGRKEKNNSDWLGRTRIVTGRHQF